ncbi:MAG: hypothetical protein EOO21_00255 [Comamonadaceae bacterium]|nr:MAG: hypothetical protein EOO21_00255 [Comamonadaceae bacterium]
MATWIEAALERQAMPRLAELMALLDRWPVDAVPDLEHAAAAVRRLQECVQAMPVAVTTPSWIQRMVLRSTPKAAVQLGDMHSRASAQAKALHEQSLALSADNEQRSRVLRTLAADLSLGVGALERVVEHCEGLLADMRSSLLERRPTPGDPASTALLLQLVERSDRYGRCLRGLRKVVEEGRGLTILLNVVVARREAVADALGTSLPGIFRQWEQKVQRLMEASEDSSATPPKAEELQDAAGRLLARLREAGATCVQARIDQAALEQARERMDEVRALTSPTPPASVRGTRSGRTSPTDAPLAQARPLQQPPRATADGGLVVEEEGSESAWQRFELLQQACKADIDDVPQGKPTVLPAGDDATRTGPTLAELISFVRAAGYACPCPAAWAGLHALLPPLDVNGRLHHPPDILDAEDARIPAGRKRLRLLEHIAWADRSGCLARVDGYLRHLPPSDWVPLEST